MGEIAEDMLDGTCCETCGEYISEGPGYPRYCCQQCADDRGAEFLPLDDDDFDPDLDFDEDEE